MSHVPEAVAAHIREQAAAYCESSKVPGYLAGVYLFAPAGMPLEAFSGYMRQLLVSYHGRSDGYPDYRCAGGRMTRREHAG